MAYEFDINTGQYVDTNSAKFVADSSSTNPPLTNPKEKSDAITVSDAMQLAKVGLESIRVKIIGEISELSNKRGYKAVYFSVKDEKSSLPCLMWKNRYDASGVELTVGALVEITGRFSLYAAKGRMNFDVSSIALAGEGDLRMKVARLAKKLELEGLTSATRKLPIPQFPLNIGVVTSPRGAAIQDVLRTLRRRMPAANVEVAGVPVEGAQAPKGLIEAIDCVEKASVEVILLVRGGGSFEDLMPFNDEALARKIAACSVPIVTGIGHEPDTTIADLVSDLRASTPTAAAESVSSNYLELERDLTARFASIGNSFLHRIKASGDRLDSVSSRPIFADVSQLYSAEFQNLDYLQEKLSRSMPQICKNYENQIAIAAAKLHDKSPLVVLSRGYSVARDVSGKVINSVNKVSKEDDLEVLVLDGKINCTVHSVDEQKLEEVL